MKSNFEDCLARVLASEGGFVNNVIKLWDDKMHHTKLQSKQSC